MRCDGENGQTRNEDNPTNGEDVIACRAVWDFVRGPHQGQQLSFGCTNRPKTRLHPTKNAKTSNQCLQRGSHPDTPFKHVRCFCRSCGAALGEILSEENSFPLVAHCLDDDPIVRNRFHEFVADKPAWYAICDDAKQRAIPFGPAKPATRARLTRFADLAQALGANRRLPAHGRIEPAEEFRGPEGQAP